MTTVFHRAWSDFVQPLIVRPDLFQTSAVCYRRRGTEIEVLIITSLDTGRWIIPKGWPMKDLDAAEASAVEAWEEAGVVAANVDKTPLGSFRYRKRLSGGEPVPCETKVFLIEVERLEDDYPHKGRRQRQWVSPQKAAAAVDEPGLKELLLSLPARLQTT